MGLFSKKQTIAVHDGRFHADDIFACATLRILLNDKTTIVRTRNPELIARADYVVDVGGIYNPSTKRFDHHQQGGAGVRENGIPYAAFGLVWKEYGVAISGSPEIATRVEEQIVLAIDAGDNGVDLYNAISSRPLPFVVQAFMYTFLPTWREDQKKIDTIFFDLVLLAEKVLRREIEHARIYCEAKSLIANDYAKSEDKRIVVLSDRYPWEEITIQYPELLFVVAPRIDGKWKIEGIFKEWGRFERRAYCPHSWAGLRDEELEKATGVKGALFCHNGRFIATAKSKEGALALAKLALESQ